MAPTDYSLASQTVSSIHQAHADQLYGFLKLRANGCSEIRLY